MFSWWGWLEFFKTDDKKSMNRLLSFMAFWPASYVTATVGEANKITAMSILLGAYVLQTGVSTIGNAISQKQPANIAVDNIENAENLTSSGDVTVNKAKTKGKK